MDLLRIAQSFNSTSEEKSSELLKTVDVNYCIPDTLLGGQTIRKKWAGYTSLHIAVMNNDLNLANELLKQDADLFKQGTVNGRTPLHVVLDNEHVYGMSELLQRHSLINTLLSRQVEIDNTLNPKCKNGVSHLHIACIVNHVKAVEFFAKAKEPLNQPINCDSSFLRGYTPLHCAIEYSSVEAVDILLEHGADICVENTKGVSCLHLLVQRIKDMSDVIKMGKRTLCMSYKKKIERLESIVELVLKKRANNDLLADGDIGLSALHIACTLRDKSIVEDLLKKGVDVNTPVKSDSKLWPGWTPLHFAACFDIETMMLLMQNGANVLMKNCKGKNALDLCAKRFAPAEIQLILSMENKFKEIVLSDNSTKLSDLLISMNNYSEFRNFLEKLKDVNVVIPLDSPIWPGYSLLHLAVSLNERTKTLLEKDLGLPESADSVPERYNCTEDEESLYMKRIELLLEHGCSISTKNANEQTAIHLAFGMHRKATVKKLLNHDEDDVVDQNGLSHLHIACALRNLDAVNRYVSRGADVNSRVKTSFDWRVGSLETIRANSTPLHITVVFDYLDIVEYLLENNADVYAQDSLGFTPIHLSLSTRFLADGKMAKLLFNATPNLRDSVSSGGLSHLHVAAWATTHEALEDLLRNGAEVDRVVEADVCSFLDPWAGKTPLLVAVAEYSDKDVKALLKAGANVYTKDSKGISSLKYALQNMHIGSATPFLELVKSGELDEFDVEACGMTLLHVACGDAEIEWAEQLLESGADVNARVSDNGEEWNGATPLYMLIYVARQCYDDQSIVDFVELLIDEGADVTLECDGITPLHLVYDHLYTYRCDEEDDDDIDESGFYLRTLDLLLESHKSYDVNPCNSKGFSHFHCACVRNDVETVTKFLDHGVDVNLPIDPLEERDDNIEDRIGGFTPLHFAMAHHSRGVAYLLLKRGADVNAEDAEGNKPLHLAIKKKFVDLPLIETMLGLGADIHAENLSGKTPLCCLLESGNLTLRRLEFFLKCGCLINALDTTDKFHRGIIGFAMRSAEPTELLPILERLMRVDEVKKAIQNGFNAIQSIVAIDGKGRLTLDDYLNAVELFINNGCDIDQQSVYGATTALHAAVLFDNLEALNALLQLGADMNVVDDGNESPFTDDIIELDDDDNEPREREVVKPLACHVWKMRLAGLELTESNLRCLDKVEEQFSLTNLLEQSCQDELTKAEETEICEGLTVRNFLSELGAVAEYPRMYPIQRVIVDKYFKCTVHLRREFPEFCGLLAFQYRKALAKMKLWQPAKAAVLCLYQVELPDLCVEAILRYFTNSEMKLIIKLANELN